MVNIKRSDIKSLIKRRKIISDKSDYGHALLVAGKMGYMGAAVIAAKSALRSGVGLLTVNVPTEERYILQCAIPEAMLMMREETPFPPEKFSAVGMGPGLGTDHAAKELLANVMLYGKKPLLLDADALNILSTDKQLLNNIPNSTIITPHAKEFDRLFGEHGNTNARISTAIEKAKAYRIIIVLKGCQTAIVSDEKQYYNTTGNAGLAKGGSGDALTGIITSFLAQGYSPIDAAIVGVYIHGLAADITLKQQSMATMMITDVIKNFGKAFKSVHA
ncbi:MAG: NAD(P)H-hydrate dehydratase [Bacteroidetes bacterium]|nr:MAG: NAD(P)H-hydrate dehydratase [Bacteroidota bacterium]